MAKTARSANGNSRGNTIVLNRVKIMFQVFPGKKGTDAERGIPDVDFTLSIGKAKSTGKTAADGGVEIDIPASSEAKLEIFNTEYKVKVIRSIEAETTKKGAKSRLTALGYELGAINDTLDLDVDRATSNFQADTDLNAEGVNSGDFDTTTEAKLKSEFGE
jgi:hypothetical protein